MFNPNVIICHRKRRTPSSFTLKKHWVCSAAGAISPCSDMAMGVSAPAYAEVGIEKVRAVRQRAMNLNPLADECFVAAPYKSEKWLDFGKHSAFSPMAWRSGSAETTDRVLCMK